MTLSTTTLLGLLKQQKYEFFSGVPCSNFADLFQQVSLDNDITSVPAASEGSAKPITAADSAVASAKALTRAER